MRGLALHHMGGEHNEPAVPAMTGLRAWVLAGLLALAVVALCVPARALAVGPDAVMYPAGWNSNAVARGDDTSNLVVNIPFTMNWLGKSYTQLYLNMNGNVTFSGSFTSYTPATLSSVGQGIMAPFWADVDTRYVGAPNQMYYSNIASGSVPTVDGHKAFLVTWSNVMRYNGSTQAQDATSTFQLVIVDRSDTGAGNFDFIYNYDKIAWDLGTASGGNYARAGWAATTGESYELPGSGTAGALVDAGSSATSLVQNSLDSGGQIGRYEWQVRSGAPPNSPPVISTSDRVIEANASTGYTGYDPSADATATDADGYVWTLSDDCPATLPFGPTSVTWTATDNHGAVTTATEQVTVVDTTPPANPALSSASHSPGVWSANPLVSVDGTGASDAARGVAGFSYSWSQDSPSAPDKVADALATTAWSTTTTSAVTRTSALPVALETFAGSTWPAGTTVGATDAAYLRLTNTAGRTRGSYAAEAYANNNTRRYPSFTQDFDLSALASATITWWDQVSNLPGNGDYARVEYSLNGGSTWTTLQSLTAPAGWTRRTYALPTGGVVRVRFSASVHGSSEYMDWDDVAVTGYKVTTSAVSDTRSSVSFSRVSAPGEGAWYFNLRTLDAAGNWSSPVSYGAVDIDTVKPATRSDAPSGWTSGTVSVSLVATDPSGPIVSNRYQLDGSSVATYSGPIAVSGDGTHTLLYYSVDAAGNMETTQTAKVLIDSSPPSVPTSVTASAVSTQSATVRWTASTDMLSGVSYYGVYRDGSLIATASALTYADSGLTPGATYSYEVVAFNGANVPSTKSVASVVTLPDAAIWLSMSTDAVDMGSLNPGVASTIASATTVRIGGVGAVTYDLYASAQDFANADVGSTTPTMPIGVLRYATNGWATLPLQQFTTAPYRIDTSTGTAVAWRHEYQFDYVLTPPWTCDAGTYTTRVTYSVVSR